MATMEKVKEWDDDQLLDWIQEKRPKLLRVGENLEKFKAAQISGEVFLMLAGDMEFFEKKCHLPVGPSRGLAELAREIAGGEIKQGKLLSFIQTFLAVNTHYLLSPFPSLRVLRDASNWLAHV